MTLSIFTHLIAGAVAVAFASPVFAFGTDTPVQNVLPRVDGVEVAQTTATVLSDSDIRRINHYSAQTMDAILAFQTGTDTESEIATLRQRVQRLVDAGQRSGMTLVQTADYFQAYLAENNRGPLPGALLDTGGRFDARSLFSSTIVYFENRAPQEVDVAAVDEADRAAIASVATQLSPKTPAQPLTLQLSVVQPSTVVVVDLPKIAPDAPASIRAILERVRLKGDQWVITVAQGDSLGQFANALYGDTLFFQRIYEANIGVLSTPNSISIGQELVLPKE